MTRRVTALFDNRAAAEAVAAHLQAHDGVAPEQVHLVPGEGRTRLGAGSGVDETLSRLLLPDPERQAWLEGLRRGGTVVSAELEDDLVEHALDVFEDHGAVDLDARTEEWRRDGWAPGGATDEIGLMATGVIDDPGTGALNPPTGTHVPVVDSDEA